MFEGLCISNDEDGDYHRHSIYRDPIFYIFQKNLNRNNIIIKIKKNRKNLVII